MLSWTNNEHQQAFFLKCERDVTGKNKAWRITRGNNSTCRSNRLLSIYFPSMWSFYIRRFKVSMTCPRQSSWYPLAPMSRNCIIKLIFEFDKHVKRQQKIKLFINKNKCPKDVLFPLNKNPAKTKKRKSILN